MYRYGAALALLALASIGCSEEYAGTLPSPSPVTTSATPSPTPTNPRSEVEAAARAYFAALERAGKTGDVTALDRLLSPTCECREQVTAIRKDAQAGRHVTTTFIVESVGPHDVTATTASATVTYSSPASQLVDASGKTVRSFAARSHAGVDLSFRRVGSTWLLDRVVRLGA